MSLGAPRLHYRAVASTNRRAWELAQAGATHGTLITATAQTHGRGRQGRAWTAPPGRALLCSLVLRDPPRLLSLAAGTAVADVVGERARLKWPNDVLLESRKVAGVLVEGRPQERWAVVGIGLNVAMAEEDFPPELRKRAGGLGWPVAEIEPTLERLLARLERWITASPEAVLGAVRQRDVLLGQVVRWQDGQGQAVGVDDAGRLVVRVNGGRMALEAGEVHLV